MPTSLLSTGRVGLALGFAFAATTALAEPLTADAVPTAAAPARLPFAATPLAADRLGASRARAGVDNRVITDGSITNTSASQVVTGHNTIADGSFANSSGLSTVIQNSGANVLIQNATIVNVQFK